MFAFVRVGSRELQRYSGKPSFGYEIHIASVGPAEYRAAFLPITDPPLPSFKIFPKPVTVHADELIDVPIFQKPATFQPPGYLDRLALLLDRPLLTPPPSDARLTDYLQIVPKNRPSCGIPDFPDWARTPEAGANLILDEPHLSTVFGDLGSNGPWRCRRVHHLDETRAGSPTLARCSGATRR